MTKKEYCTNNRAIAYYSGFGGLEIHGIEHGVNDYVYCTASAWYGGNSAKTYHKLRIYYGEKYTYFNFKGQRVFFDDCIRMN